VTSVASFFSRVLNRTRSNSQVEGGNEESLLSHVDWRVVDVCHPDESGNTPLHVLLKVLASIWHMPSVIVDIYL
jgi:hypothetical protein